MGGILSSCCPTPEDDDNQKTYGSGATQSKNQSTAIFKQPSAGSGRQDVSSSFIIPVIIRILHNSRFIFLLIFLSNLD